MELYGLQKLIIDVFSIGISEERKEQIAYEYLCRLEEAKKWIEHLLKEELPEVTIFEQNLRNGVVLATSG